MNKLPELLPGEEICPKCKGKGKVEVVGGAGFEFRPVCELCRGQKKIDWVTKAMGEQAGFHFASLQLPLIRHAYPKLLAEDLISVQPMEGPVGNIWKVQKTRKLNYYQVKKFVQSVMVVLNKIISM